MINRIFILILAMVCCAASQDVSLSSEVVGIPVKSVNWVRLFAVDSYPEMKAAYITMGQSPGSLITLRVDVNTGKFKQFACNDEKSSFPTAAALASDGSLYIAAAWSGRLFRLAPGANELEDCGLINEGKVNFPTGVDEDGKGNIWIGGYPTCDLTMYDPKEKKFTNYGRIDDVDMYNYLNINKDGKVINLVKFTKPHIVIFDPESGKRVVAGPLADDPQSEFNLVKDLQGWVYLRYKEDYYSIKGFEVTKVDNAPLLKNSNKFTDGTTVSFADADSLLNRQLKVTLPDGTNKQYELDYAGTGSRIFHLAKGPDDILYGSSYLPLHLFKFDTATGELHNFGRASKSGGEVYSMAHLDGKLYMAAYGDGNFSVYDPKLPFHYGESDGDNPRHLGRIDPNSSRPRSSLVCPDGKIWVASMPDYGLYGGALASYDPATGEKKAFNLAGDGSCFTLAYLEGIDILAVGTTIQAGTGTVPKVDAANIMFWDCSTEKVTWQGTVDEQATVYNALVSVGDKLYGTLTRKDGRHKLFCFDAAKKQVVWAADLPSRPLELGLIYDVGELFGFTINMIYKVDMESGKINVIIEEIDGFEVPGPIIGDYIYYAKQQYLKRLKIR